MQKLLGAGFNPDKNIGDLVSQGAGWLTTFLHSLWSGGRALVSLFSLVVVTPVVAFYLLYDWHRMIRTVDDAVPRNQRETVRELAREIDAAIAGFVRGQTAVCLILGSFYAVALTLSGLNFGLLIGLISGLITFIPYVGSLTGLVLAVGVAVAQFWPDWTSILTVLGIFLVGQFLEGNVLSPKLVGESVGSASGLADLRAVRLRLSVRLRRLAGGGAAGGHDRRAGAVCASAATGKPALYRRGFGLSGIGSSAAPRQLALALDHATSFAREDFLAGPSNAAALSLIERWPDWPDRVMALAGPEGSGKSHLASIWARGRGRARAGGETARATATCRRRSRPARWWSRISSPAVSTSARCSICSISRARSAPLC